MSDHFDFGVFEQKVESWVRQGGSAFGEFDFLAELDRNQRPLDRSGSFRFQENKDLSLNDFPDLELEEPDRHSQKISDIFRMEKPNSNYQQDEANRSRHLSDISIEGSPGSSGNRFVYQRQPPTAQPPNDQSFEMLNREVKQQKPRDFKDLFKELSQDDKKNPNDSFMRREKYSNREEFEEYLINLKLEKRRAEEQHQLEQQLKSKGDVFRRPQQEAAGRSASYISAERNNFETKPSTKSIRQQIDFNSESSATNKSNSEDLKRGQYLQQPQPVQEPERHAGDPFDNFNFDELRNNSFKLDGQSPHIQHKESYQFGQQAQDFWKEQPKERDFSEEGHRPSDFAVGNLGLRSNVESNRQLDAQRNIWSGGGSQPSFDSRKSQPKSEPRSQPKSEPKVDPQLEPRAQPERPTAPQNVKAKLFGATYAVAPTKEISKPPPMFQKLLQDDMMNPNFDEALVTQPPRTSLEQAQPAAPEPIKPTSSKALPPPKPAVKLTTIREENSNIFQKTVEQEKLGKLLQNYERMKNNFDALINEMKANTEGQQKIMTELATLKHDYSDSRALNVQQLEQERRLRMEAINDKELKVLELKKELETIRSDERTLVQRQICERIASLEDIVKKSFEEMNSDKRQHMIWVNPEIAKQKASPSVPQSPPIQQHDQFSMHVDENVPQHSRKAHQQDLAESVIQQIYSPLQLRLDNIQSPSANGEIKESRKVTAFEFSKAVTSRRYQGECYRPNKEHFDPNFKTACIHDQAVIYESFDFLVNCRYSMVKSAGRKVLKLAVTLRNKTVLTLSDLIVVVYGSVGEALSVNPARIFAERLLPDDLLTFQAYLSNIVVDSHHINMQLSYRSEALSKKKLQIKLPRPITKFFDMQFTHEDQFNNIWQSLSKELYVEARLLNFRTIRSSQDLKVMLPFLEVQLKIIQLSEQDEHQFSLGLLFQLFNVEGMLLLKLLCSVDGRASLHLRYQHEAQRQYCLSILDTINALLFD